MRTTKSLRALGFTALTTLTIAATVLHGSDAWAQTDAATTEARARFNEGLELADKGDHEAARLKFGQAWVLIKTPTVLYNLARSEQLTGNHLLALEHFRTFMRMANDPKITEAQKKRVAEFITELSQRVGRIQVEAPPNARILVDGKNNPEDPSFREPIPVAVGRHVVEATHEGRTKSVTVDCAAGAIAKASFAFDDAPAQPHAQPVAPPPAEPGADYSTQGGRPSFWTAGRIVGTGIAVVGLGVVGGGVLFTLKASDEGKEGDAIAQRLPAGNSACYQNASADCAALKKSRDDEAAQKNVALGMFIGGGVAVVGGLTLFLLSGPSRKSSAASHFTPVFDATGGKLFYTATF